MLGGIQASETRILGSPMSEDLGLRMCELDLGLNVKGVQRGVDQEITWGPKNLIRIQNKSNNAAECKVRKEGRKEGRTGRTSIF